VLHVIVELCLKCIRFCWFSVGSEKLGFTIERVVLECDGTEIEEDEELLALQGAVFIGLKGDEVWCPAATPTSAADPPEPEASTSAAAATEIIPTTCKLHYLKEMCLCAVHNV